MENIEGTSPERTRDWRPSLRDNLFRATERLQREDQERSRINNASQVGGAVGTSQTDIVNTDSQTWRRVQELADSVIARPTTAHLIDGGRQRRNAISEQGNAEHDDTASSQQLEAATERQAEHDTAARQIGQYEAAIVSAMQGMEWVRQRRNRDRQLAASAPGGRANIADENEDREITRRIEATVAAMERRNNRESQRAAVSAAVEHGHPQQSDLELDSIRRRRDRERQRAAASAAGEQLGARQIEAELERIGRRGTQKRQTTTARSARLWRDEEAWRAPGARLRLRGGSLLALVAGGWWLMVDGWWLVVGDVDVDGDLFVGGGGDGGGGDGGDGDADLTWCYLGWTVMLVDGGFPPTIPSTPKLVVLCAHRLHKPSSSTTTQERDTRRSRNLTEPSQARLRDNNIMCRMVTYSGTCIRCGDEHTWVDLTQELSCLEAKNRGAFGECTRGIMVEEHPYDQECDRCTDEDEGIGDVDEEDAEAAAMGDDGDTTLVQDSLGKRGAEEEHDLVAGERKKQKT
ncbi:hypothetical protein G7046_g6848 [Stylonectria norvegica]|nr:hypothetical protein G7046_g6848 [Stylonectria norvegica]